VIIVATVSASTASAPEDYLPDGDDLRAATSIDQRD
jgi:hypothetical protein